MASLYSSLFSSNTVGAIGILQHQGRKPGKKLCITSASTSSSSDGVSSLDRRQFVLGTSTALGLSLGTGSLAQAEPVQVGDLSSCQRATLPNAAAPVSCCPPPGASTSLIDFTFDTSLPMRTRPAAHLVDASYVAKYNRAYQLLRALPETDPRRFSHQANVHCAYCNGAFSQDDGSNLQIHFNWLFLPWHRWYLYFHERMLASLINDDTFALPFWNWDDQSTGGNSMPAMYLNNPGLADTLRERKHLPPRLVDLNFNGVDSTVSNQQQRAENNALMYQQVVSAARTPTLFMGLAYRAGDDDAPGGGTLENAPHGPVHVWTGSSSQPNFENMGSLYSAARDPLFFAHHANIDRIWSVWKSLGGRRRDFTDPDWLNATFAFYDEKAQLVRVKVSDALDSNKLRYMYQSVNNEWLNARPSARAANLVSDGSTISIAGGMQVATAGILGHIKDDIEELGEAAAGKLRKLKDVYRSRVKRPVKSAVEKLKLELQEGDEAEEVLVIQGVEIDCDKATKFDVFINLPEANESTPTNCIEYAGTFVNVPHLGMHPGGKRQSTLRIGIGDKLEQLGIKDAEDIVVTLVPKGVGKQSPVVFKGIKIEYD